MNSHFPPGETQGAETVNGNAIRRATWARNPFRAFSQSFHSAASVPISVVIVRTISSQLGPFPGPGPFPAPLPALRLAMTPASVTWTQAVDDVPMGRPT